MKSSRRRVPLKKSRKTKRSIKKHSVRKRRTAKKGGCDCMMKGGDGYVNGPTFTGEPNPPFADETVNPNDPSIMHDARLIPVSNEPSVDILVNGSQAGGRRRRRNKIYRSKKGGNNPLDTMMTRDDGTMNTNNLVGSGYNSNNLPIA